MTSTDGILNQYKGCIASVFGECEIFDDLTDALKRIKELETQLAKQLSATEPIVIDISASSDVKAVTP